MAANSSETGQAASDCRAPRDTVSRREFLKTAGLAGAAFGVGGGLVGLLTACGGTEEGTTSTLGPASTAPASTTATTQAAGTTAVSTTAEMGREVKVGVIAPITGIYAVFAVADKWGLGLIDKYLGDTWVLGDGKSHKVSWLLRDTQSDTNRTAQITSDLIMNDKVDLLAVGGGPDTTLPTCDVAETIGCPLISVIAPWQAWVFGRGKTLDTAEKWVYGQVFGIEQATAGAVQVFEKIPSNKVVAIYLSNTVDGQTWLSPNFGIEDTLKAAGYTVAPFTLYNQGTEDYSSLLSAYKKAGCELQFGSNPGKDFSVYWRQAQQQSFHPKVCIEIVGLSSYEDQVALGDAAYGIIMGYGWHRSWPYSDIHISGMTNQQLAEDYEISNDAMWSKLISGYARMGWAVDVLKRTKDLDDKESVLEAIRTTKTELITGPIDLTSPVTGPSGMHVTPNLYKQVWGFGQILRPETGSKWKFNEPLVGQIDAPEVKVDADPVTLTY